jgi:hypothetical protein
MRQFNKVHAETSRKFAHQMSNFFLLLMFYNPIVLKRVLQKLEMIMKRVKTDESSLQKVNFICIKQVYAIYTV